jgi:hypothetical protein
MLGPLPKTFNKAADHEGGVHIWQWASAANSKNKFTSSQKPKTCLDPLCVKSIEVRGDENLRSFLLAAESCRSAITCALYMDKPARDAGVNAAASK